MVEKANNSVAIASGTGNHQKKTKMPMLQGKKLSMIIELAS